MIGIVVGKNTVPLESSLASLGLKIAKVTKGSAQAGYFRGARYRSEPLAKPPTLATIAAVHQFGAPSRNIPARPFVTQGMKIGKGKIVKTSSVALRAAVRTGANKAALILIAESMRSALQDGIDYGKFVPLKQRTIEARRMRLRALGIRGTSTKPLIFTGQLRNRVEYRVVL
uniref:Hypothetical conserved protein n=1 Tax=uncultured prokaryote TaxID=198431 RepID=H5S8Z8_9ZZZZ|nr:hypothetical conserved protein [uncultured prokaryote]